MPAHHNIAAERELWDTYAESAFKPDAEPAFCWTQYTGHGPGPELLGTPATVLEIGCGTGRALAHLAEQGVKATGVDLSPVMVDKTRERWQATGTRIECAEVLDYLAETTDTYDAVYSVFGAAWFTDPARLFPLVAQRLNPGGAFVFSQPPRSPARTDRRACIRAASPGRPCSRTATATPPRPGKSCFGPPDSPRHRPKCSTPRSRATSEP